MNLNILDVEFLTRGSILTFMKNLSKKEFLIGHYGWTKQIFPQSNYLTDDHDPSLVEKCCHQQVSWRAGMLHWYHLLKQDHYREDPRVTSNVLSPVTIKCLMHEPCKGEILVGFVDKILKCRVSLSRDHMIACFFRRRRWGDCNSFLLPRLILNILLWFGCWLGLLWLNFWLHVE